MNEQLFRLPGAVLVRQSVTLSRGLGQGGNIQRNRLHNLGLALRIRSDIAQLPALTEHHVIGAGDDLGGQMHHDVRDLEIRLPIQ